MRGLRRKRLDGTDMPEELKLVWEFDDAKAATDVGTYRLMRSIQGVSILSLDWDVIHRCGSGGHAENIKRAEEHYATQKEKTDVE